MTNDVIVFARSTYTRCRSNRITLATSARVTAATSPRCPTLFLGQGQRLPRQASNSVEAFGKTNKVTDWCA